MAKNKKVDVEVELRENSIDNLEQELLKFFSTDINSRWEKYSKPLVEKSEGEN